jgi:Zn-dependent M28 family amino/carboxypeptidase
MKRISRSRVVIVALALATTVGVSTSVNADQPIDTSDLRDAVTVEGIMTHLEAFQEIADDHGGNRAAGTAGYQASGDYVQGLLEAAGYDVTIQEFSYDRPVVLSALVEQVSPNPAVYERLVDFYEMSYSPDGSANAPVTAVDVNLTGDRASTSGCEADDFAGFPSGNIALIQRGTCPFRQKAENAELAEASAVIIFNQGNDDPSDDRFGLFGGTLDPEPAVTVPVLSMGFELGAELATTAGLVLNIDLETEIETIETFNVLADSATGRADRTVVVGAHLDSVPEGPGINDNGSGSAAILETALQMADETLTNRVRFAFWGGEEDGLIGSSYYVSQLSARDLKNHALNLNFDMVGSPNFARFVYDGDGSSFGLKGPNGSSLIESVFNSYFGSNDLAIEATAFDGRSDYFAFINAGIPAGGLFTGAEDIKSAAQVEDAGGTAGIAFDPCYHAACDDIDNLSPIALDEMSDAIAHSVLTFAETSAAVNGTSKGKAGQAQLTMNFKGDLALR